MNFAAWKYRNILASDGGPIAKLSSRKVEGGYESFAWLLPELGDPGPQLHQIYGSPDGTGTGQHGFEASWKAISEAMERWAFHATVHSENSTIYGFDVDPTTSGMAAFPGLTGAQARETARLEAIERWSLCRWWEGKLSARSFSSSSTRECLEILTSFQSAKTVVMHAKDPVGQFHCYGFATGKSIAIASGRAEIELRRNHRALNSYFSVPKKDEKILTLTSEKRLAYFSTTAGYSEFLERANDSSTRIGIESQNPVLLIDRQVVGPWSKYCQVWRCLYEGGNGLHLSKSTNYFLF